MTTNASHATSTDPSAVPAVGSRLDAESGIGYLVVLATRELTGGRMTELEAVCGPGAPGVAERSFENHEVRFEVLEGRLTVGMASEPHDVGAGAALTVPAGTPHRIWVEVDRGPARFIWRMRPATEETDLTGLVFGEPASGSRA
jgi:mannose-6-phosphate isomerase-like protein (cupin superfamily)